MWRFETNQDREAIGDFECGRDLSVPTVAAQTPLPDYHSSVVGIWNRQARHDRDVASFFGATDPRLETGWSLVDLGTGTGIFALAAKCLGARRVLGIDNDPAAVSVAKSNARSNKIRGASFQIRDVHKWNSAGQIDVIAANLYSDLLVELLPKLGGSRWLILSGILCSQQNELVRALRRNHFNMINVKRRGKWVAILAKRRGTLRPPELKPANLCGGH